MRGYIISMQGYMTMEPQSTIAPLNTTLLFPRLPTIPSINHSTTKENSVEQQLDALFPEQRHEDKTVKRTKEILGDLAKEFGNEEIQVIATEVQYLCETWLDVFERSVFKGQTLNELLNEG